MTYVSRRRLAEHLAKKTSSQAKSDRRGQGPGGAIHVSATHVVYPAERVAAWLEAKGLAPLPETIGGAA